MKEKQASEEVRNKARAEMEAKESNSSNWTDRVKDQTVNAIQDEHSKVAEVRKKMYNVSQEMHDAVKEAEEQSKITIPHELWCWEPKEEKLKSLL